MDIYLQNVPNLYFRIDACLDDEGSFIASFSALRGIRMNNSLFNRTLSKVFKSVDKGKEPLASQIPNTVYILNNKLNAEMTKLYEAGKVELFDIEHNSDTSLYGINTGRYFPDDYVTYSPYSYLRKPIPNFKESVH